MANPTFNILTILYFLLLTPVINPVILFLFIFPFLISRWGIEGALLVALLLDILFITTEPVDALHRITLVLFVFAVGAILFFLNKVTTMKFRL